MNRRALLKALGSTVLISAALAPVWSAAQTVPNVTSPLFHLFGTLSEPVEVQRVFAAGPAASLMLNSVAPKQLIGWPMALPESALPWFNSHSQQLPVVGGLVDVDNPISTQQLQALSPNVIVDVVEVASPERLHAAQQLSTITGIPYLVIEGGLTDVPEQLRTLGALLGHQRHGQQLAQAAQHALDKWQQASRSAAQQQTLPSLPEVGVAWAQIPSGLNQLSSALWWAASLQGTDSASVTAEVRQLCILFNAIDPAKERLNALLSTPVTP